MTSAMMFPTGDAANNTKNVLSVIAILLYPTYIGAIYWALDSSLFNISGRTLFFSSVVVVVLGMHLLGYTSMLFNVARQLNSSGYTIKEDKVYLDGKMIVGADPATFQSLTGNLQSNISVYENPYTKDKNKVYYRGELVKDANPGTVEVIDDYKLWLKDKSSVFYEGIKLEGVSSGNFILKNNSYIFTPDKIFYRSKEIKGADSNSFILLRDSIAKDKNNIYYDDRVIFPQADTQSFQMYPEDGYASRYGFDQKHLYDPYMEVTYRDVDIESFKGFERGYYTDNNAVYTDVSGNLVKLEGANPKTFVVTDWNEETQSDANDGNLYFVNGDLVK